MPTAAQMIEINTAIVALIIAIIVGFTSVIGTGFAIMKWYLPNIFKHRDEQRKLENDALQADIENKRASNTADVERDRVLPQLVSGINNFAASNAQMTQNLGALIQNRIEQDTRMVGELHAHTLAVTGVTEGLDELRGEFQTLQKEVEKAVTQISKNTDASKDAKLSSDTAAAQANITLELVKTFGLKLETITQAAKHDSRPIPAIQADITLHTAETPPDELKPTG